jgi:hypothetical protein
MFLHWFKHSQSDKQLLWRKAQPINNYSDIKHNQSDKQVLWRKADKHLHFRQAQLNTNK